LKPLCIYHGNCDDGFAAAWCVRAAFGDDVEFYPGVYQKEPPPHEGRDVLFVDFTYKRPVLDAMSQSAKSILILDHHKTAQEDLADIEKAPRRIDWRDAAKIDGSGTRMFALFDLERSGAALAWDYFIGDGSAIGLSPGQAKHRREFIDYIQDRDLWLKRLPGGDEFTIALRSYPQVFSIWDDLIRRGPKDLIVEGRSIQRYYRLRVEELKASAYQATMAEHPIWIANAPYFAASEVAGELAERGLCFGACYFEAEGGRFQYSLRSRGDVDVSAVARQFGGGGHRAAAGFSTDQPIHRK
jgi:oligoribonuclease NrnB/cAMP/cGMP phosphodiesterase (DHH superfamily)